MNHTLKHVLKIKSPSGLWALVVISLLLRESFDQKSSRELEHIFNEFQASVELF